MTDDQSATLMAEAKQAAFELLFVKGLYSSISLKGPLGERIEKTFRNQLAVGCDMYCVRCKMITTFRISPKGVSTAAVGGPYREHVSPPAVFGVHAACQRDFTVYTYILNFKDDSVQKIGQIPSTADIAFGELKTLDKGLETDDRKELGKALGLFAHDTALGAFVYLRRVFERMISRAHERQTEKGHPIEGFAGMRMEDRIAALGDELPGFVVENSAVFSVLSLGLHELTEDQCSAHFPVLKAVLFQMLENEEHLRKKQLTEASTRAAFQKILSNPRPASPDAA